jgi:hypothetical protein
MEILKAAALPIPDKPPAGDRQKNCVISNKKEVYHAKAQRISFFLCDLASSRDK